MAALHNSDLQAQIEALRADLAALRELVADGAGLPDPNHQTGRVLTLSAQSVPTWTFLPPTPAPTWGSIVGNIQHQTDLQAALVPKWGEITGWVAQQTDLQTILNTKGTLTAQNNWTGHQILTGGWRIGSNPPSHLIPAEMMARVTTGDEAGVNWVMGLSVEQTLGRGAGLALGATFNSGWGGSDRGQRYGGGIAYIPIGSSNPRHHRIALYAGHMTTDEPVEVFSASLSDDVRIHQGLHLYANAATFSGAITSPSITDTSDARHKANIRPLLAGMALIRDLLPRRFWNRQTQRDDIGFVAQEVRQHAPEVVIEREGDLSVAYQRLTAPIVVALQELDARMAAMEKQVGTAK